jgi:hypothetical protein
MPKAKKLCAVCDHPKREEIEACLVVEVAYREITERYGVSGHQAWSHSRWHMKKSVQQTEKMASNAGSTPGSTQNRGVRGLQLERLERVEKWTETVDDVLADHQPRLRQVEQLREADAGQLEKLKGAVFGEFLPRLRAAERWLSIYGPRLEVLIMPRTAASGVSVDTGRVVDSGPAVLPLADWKDVLQRFRELWKDSDDLQRGKVAADLQQLIKGEYE